MPPIAAFWRGLDIDDRLALGLLDQKAARQEHKHRQSLNKALTRFLVKEGRLKKNTNNPLVVLRACLAFLAAGPSQVILANLEDLWAVRRGALGSRTRHPGAVVVAFQPAGDPKQRRRLPRLAPSREARSGHSVPRKAVPRELGDGVRKRGWLWKRGCEQWPRRLGRDPAGERCDRSAGHSPRDLAPAGVQRRRAQRGWDCAASGQRSRVAEAAAGRRADSARGDPGCVQMGHERSTSARHRDDHEPGPRQGARLRP